MINDKGEELGIIYGWYNTLTDMWYIGQTVRPEDRFKSHIILSENNDKSYFHKALRKYSLENWVYCVLEDNVLRANLNMREMDWIEYYDSYYSGYNLTLGGGGSVSRICTEETKKKISDAKVGKPLSEQAKQRMSESRKGKPSPMQGKHHSEETKKRLSEIEKGAGNPFYGRHHTEETKKKISEAHKRENNGFYGRHHTEESKRKMSEAYKRRQRRPSILKGPKNGMYGKPAPNRKQVSKYDLNGNFIKKYDCIKDAIKENPKASHLKDVCQGLRKQAGGFIWKYAS